jgi:NAD-dependent SIR2 family protein deacetylase
VTRCDHDWILPGSAVDVADEREQVPGRCSKCGHTELRPLIVWLNLLERMIDRLARETEGVRALQCVRALQ